MPAGELDYLRVSAELLRRAVVVAVRLDRSDETVSQRAGHPVTGAREALPCKCLAGPACRKALAEHRLVGFSAGNSRFEPLAPVPLAVIADRGESPVTVANVPREPAALAVDVDRAVRRALGIQRTAS
jgi:hypothetical protein